MSDFLNEWWDDSGDFFSPQPPGETVNDLLFGFGDQQDARAQDMFFDAFLNADDSKWADFERYLQDEYGILYDHAEHWADYREWYSAA